MLPTVIRSRPSAESDFEPLSEYQSQTPETFFEGKPVLYFHGENIKAWVSKEQVDRLFFFSKAPEDGSNPLNPTPPESHALENNGVHMREESDVEVFVASNKLTLFSQASGAGVEIPYPAITLHAIKNYRNLEKPDDASLKFISVYMQLEFSDSGADDDESFDPIELTLVPSQKSSGAEDAEQSAGPGGLNTERTLALFNQISACSNLNPDPQDDDDEEDDTDRIVFEGDHEAQYEVLEGFTGAFRGDTDGGLPPPMPGSSGWITAENVHEYFDADGNWIGGEEEEGEEGVSGELGEGAGRVRGRDETEAAEEVNGHGGDREDDSKRPRTE